jgi:2-oxoglutarate dehydrogenase E2 component (dihydrolipoamide succinyltransferase)
MSRVVMIVMLVVWAFGCKSSDHPAQQAPEGSAAGSAASVAAGAGKVLEVSGQVTIGGKPLALGQSVNADDVIDTGADGRVVIELTHNLAHWQLGPNKHSKVSESIAWKLPRDEGNAKVVIQDMTAAGRPAERSAADTTATAPEPPAAEPAPGGGPPPAAAAPAAPAKAAAPARRAAAPPPPAAEPAPAPAPAPAAISAGDAEEKEEAAPRASRGPMVKLQTAPLAKCLASKTHVVIDVSVDADGKATPKFTGKISDSERACLEKAIAAQAFPAGSKAHAELP